ncbi:hypothetical protein D3C80_2219260 [compost metagenome]
MAPFSSNFVNASNDIADITETFKVLAKELLKAHDANIDNPFYECSDPVVIEWIEWARKEK